MKVFPSAIFLLVPALFSGEFEHAEDLFRQEKFDECEQMIAKALKQNLSDSPKIRLHAMHEYILGNNPDKIAKFVKEAQRTALHRGWLTADLLNHSVLLLRRAEDWKFRGIPEYQELCDAAEKLLGQLKDSGNPEIAIKQVILRTKIFNLNGDYHEPIKLLRNVLELYYPRTQNKTFSGKDSGEIELLILLGEQYAGLSVATNEVPQKIKMLSFCVRYYLEAIKCFSKDSARYQDLADRLCSCRETLRLLGYSLHLPTHIKSGKNIAISMVDEMLRMHRFHDVVLALNSKKDPAMRLRYAAALSAVGQSGNAVEVVKELEIIPEPHWLLQAAQYSLAAGEKANAIFFFQRFLELSAEYSDLLYARRQYASILLAQGEYVKGATVLLQLAEMLPASAEKQNFIFQAAQNFFQGKEFQECIKTLSLIPKTHAVELLLAQAHICTGDSFAALPLLKQLLSAKDLSQEMRHKAMKLAVFCAQKNNQSVEAIYFLEQFLVLYPTDNDVAEYSRLLLNLYLKEKASPKKFEQLAADFFTNAPGHPDTVPFLLTCAEQIPDITKKELILRKLLARKDYSSEELNAVVESIPTLQLKREFLNKYKKPFSNTPSVCKIYFQIAKTEFALQNYQKSLEYLEKLLKQPEVFLYKECKMLQIEAYIKIHNEDEVRKNCQELLLADLTLQEKRSVVFWLAESWERSGKMKKSIACAWTAVPLDGKCSGQNDQQLAQQLLSLIIRIAEKEGEQTEVNEAKEILSLLH